MSTTVTNRKAKEVLTQVAFIQECGGTLEGYIRTYGTATAPIGGGNGGEAIFAADMEYLKRLVQWAVGERKQLFGDV